MAFCIPPHLSTHLMFDKKNINVQWNVQIRNIETTGAGYPPSAMLVLVWMDSELQELGSQV